MSDVDPRDEHHESGATEASIRLPNGIGDLPSAPVWAGIALIAGGLALGLGDTYRLVPHMIRVGVSGILRGPSTSSSGSEFHSARAASRSSD